MAIAFTAARAFRRCGDRGRRAPDRRTGRRAPHYAGGLAQWRYHGRLVARQLGDAHLVIRASFDIRDLMRRQFPGTFSVPGRYAKHMMIVADFLAGDAGAIEEALEAAWRLQRDGS